MKRRACLIGGILLWGHLACQAGVIRGRVIGPQGASIESATIVARETGSGDQWTVLTTKEGKYAFEDLPPGAYVLRASKAGYEDTLHGPVESTGEASSLVINLRLSYSRESTQIRGTEERNPNSFVIRLDTNAILNELSRTGTSLHFPSEFRANHNYYGEQFGYPLRQVQTATPSRLLSDFRLSLFASHQNGALNARPFFQVGRLLPSRRNEYGFSVAGPIRKEKLSFSFQWGQVRDSGFVNGNVQVPLAGERVPLAPDSEISALIGAFLKAFPDELPNLPNVSLRQLNTNAQRDIRSTAFSAHLDYQPNRDQQVVYDQQFLDFHEKPFELVLGQNPETLLRPQAFRLLSNRNLSPSTTWQVSFNYERLGARLLLTEQYQNLLTSLGFVDPPDVQFSDELTNLGPLGMPRWRFENHFIFSSQFSHVQGNHTLASGFTLNRLRDGDMRAFNTRGVLNFSSDFGRTAVENFLMGTPSQFVLTLGDNYRGFRNWENAFFFHDHIGIRPDLTLDVGLRYEVVTAPTEANHLTTVSYRTDANNFAPQFGFAWNPRGGNTVIRGGYGIAYGTIPIVFFSRERSNPPYIQVLVEPAPDLRNLRQLLDRTPAPSIRSGLNLASPDLQVPYAHVYNLAVERRLPGNFLARIGYMGSRSFQLLTANIFNRAQDVPGIEAKTETVNQRRPDPDHQNIYYVFNNSIGYLDALEVVLNRRMSRGLAFQARYTFSKAIDTSNVNFADNGSSYGSQTEEIFSDLKGPSLFDTPHALVISYSYELPSIGNGEGLRSRLLSHWIFSGTTVFRSGTPFAVATGSDAPGFGNVDGQSGDRPDILDPSILGKSLDNPDTVTSILRPEYFDSNIPVGGRGNLGFNTFRKDGTNNWNFALSRNFQFPGPGSERQLQFRAEFFNFFNHAQFSAPGHFLTSPTFGQITNTENKGRVVQLVLRLHL